MRNCSAGLWRNLHYPITPFKYFWNKLEKLKFNFSYIGFLGLPNCPTPHPQRYRYSREGLLLSKSDDGTSHLSVLDDIISDFDTKGIFLETNWTLVSEEKFYKWEMFAFHFFFHSEIFRPYMLTNIYIVISKLKLVCFIQESFNEFLLSAMLCAGTGWEEENNYKAS